MEYSNASVVDAGEPLQGQDAEMDQEMEIYNDRLEALGIALAKKRDEWYEAKVASGIEKRWLEDRDQYMGRDEASKQVATMMDSAEAGFPVSNKGARAQRSTVFINITRSKTNTAEARVANMLLPTDDRNFALKPSPTPDLTAAAKILQKQKAAQTAQAQGTAMPATAVPGQPTQGMPPQGMQGQGLPGQVVAPQAMPLAGPSAAPAMPAGQGANAAVGAAAALATGPVTGQPPDPEALLEAAADAAKAMQDEIDDQFQECNWNGECRTMMHDAAMLGTGVLKGPIVVNKATKTWTPIESNGTTAHVLEMGSELKPTSYAVSPWCIVPDPSCGNDIHNGAGIFEFYNYTGKQLRELVEQPGFKAEQIATVLEAGPDSTQHKTALEQRENNRKQTYKVWEYWGEFEPDDMRAAGVDVEDGHTELISGCVIFVNNIVIKGFLNPLDSGDIPYDFYPWEADDESPWGYGNPYLCRPSQRVLTAAWRQLMDNAGNTVGPQIILKPGIIVPADKNWQISGNKIWNCIDPSVDVRSAFTSIDINNHAADLENIIKLARDFADEESMVPMLMQGVHADAPDTLGGMIIHQNSSNVVLGRKAKSFDDLVITRHVGRYVDWNMAYNPKPEIKGDHHVVARGTSALLVRDIQNQALMQFGSFQGSAVIAPMVNWEAWIKAVLKAQHVDSTEILKSDAEIAALKNAPPPPPPLPLQIAQLKAQSDQQIAQMKVQGDAQNTQARIQGEQALGQQKFQADMAAQQAALQADQQRLQSGELSPHAASATARIQTAQIQAQSRADVQQSRSQTELAYAQNEAQMARDNANAKLQELQMQRDLALLNYAQQHALSLQQVRADLAKTAMIEQTKRQLAGVELQMQQVEGERDRQHEAKLNATNNAHEITSQELANETQPTKE